MCNCLKQNRTIADLMEVLILVTLILTETDNVLAFIHLQLWQSFDLLWFREAKSTILLIIYPLTRMPYNSMNEHEKRRDLRSIV